MNRRPWIVGVSGASGTPYARAVINGLLDAGEPVDLVVSRAARLTLLDETGLPFRDAHWHDDLATWLARDVGDVRYWAAGDLAAGPASGSYLTQGMAVVPASTANLGPGLDTLSVAVQLYTRVKITDVLQSQPNVVETIFADGQFSGENRIETAREEERNNRDERANCRRNAG